MPGFAVFLATLLLADPVASAQRADQRVELAKTLIGRMAAGEFQAAVEPFNKRMKDVLPPPELEKAWDGNIQTFGPFQRIDAVRAEKISQRDAVIVTCRFQKRPLEARVVFTPENEITGLFFMAVYQAPGYADPTKFEETELTLGSGLWKLPATLALPKGKGPFPAVVLVHGSGPCDRDETVGANKPFRDLAHGLATRGIAVLRYEKRTREHPIAMTLLAGGITVKEETIDDAMIAVEVLAARASIDPQRIFVLGQSLGGMLLPRIAQGSKQIAGVISMAGCTRPLEDLILEQTKYLASLPGTTTEKNSKARESVERQVAQIKAADFTKKLDQSGLTVGAPWSYWRDLHSYDPAAMAKTLHVPMLILQGERDYQVTMEDFAGWKKALGSRTDVKFISYPKLNHLFTEFEGTGKGIPAEYLVAKNVAEIVIHDIAAWMKGK
jgi:uncharacterized protein